MTKPLLTHTSAAVAALFLEDPQAERYGLEIVRGASSTKGTVYPMLAKWVERGWLRSDPEPDDEFQARQETEPGAPRRYYMLTDDGRAELTQYLARWQARQKGHRVQI